MTNIIIVLIIAIVIFAYFNGSKKKQPKKRLERQPIKKPKKEDHGDFVRIISQENIHSDPSLLEEIHTDIPKGDDTSIKITTAVTGDEFIYDLIQRKWKDGLNLFYNRAPSTFINMLVNAWEELNGPLPKIKNRAKIESVQTTIKKLESPSYEPKAFENLPKNIPINGSSGKNYSVNLSNLSCTCPDFIKRRADFQPTDIRRMCKHISKSIIDTKLNAKLTKNNLIRLFVKRSSEKNKGIPLFHELIQINIDEEIKGPNPFYLLLNKDNYPLVDVLVLLKTTYNRFGYNFEEKRWSYGNNPFPHGSKTKYNFVINEFMDEYKDNR